MDGKKIYSIQINGVKESVDAIDSLVKQLDALDSKINSLQNKSVDISAGGGSKTSSSKSSLSEDEKLERQIEQIDAKRVAYSKDIYQNYLAAKDVLKETVADQKQIAAQERLQANTYTNTMQGLKAKLADIKNVMQTTDIGSDLFKKYAKEANEINNKLKELEKTYGQFGRNGGNYGSIVDEMKKIKVAVGDTVREYDNYRKAIKELKQERFQLSQTLGTEAKEYKDIDKAVKQLESDYNDLNKSSKFMDNMLDTMQGFSAIIGLGQGISTLFGIDDAQFNDSMKKLTSLLIVIKSLETLQLQIQKKDGWLGKALGFGNDTINKVFEKAQTAVQNFALSIGMVKKNTEGAMVVQKKWIGVMGMMTGVLNGLRIALMALKAVLLGAVMLLAPEILNGIGNFIKSLNTTKIKADEATESLKALTRETENRMNLLHSSYMKGALKDEEYLKDIYDAQTDSLVKQIDTLQTRAEALKKDFNFNSIGNLMNMFSSTQNTEFSGKKFTGQTTVGYGHLLSYFGGNDLNVTVKSIEEVEKAWKNCNEAIKEGKDYMDKYGQGLGDWVASLYVTVNDTTEVMRGMGNIRLSDFIASFQEVNKKFQDGKINADQYAKELAKLKKEMNSNEILNSVIANLDKYIPDEEVREAVQNVINEIMKLDDAFNMTSEQQIHHWNQVRIDAMKDGIQKELATIKENERYEIVQEGKTQEQISLIHAKYERQRLNAQEKAAKERLQKGKEAAKKLRDAENELIALRLENLKEGLDKRLELIENERRLALQKVKENGILVNELTLEINKKYDKKILDEKREWAFNVLKIYEDLAEKINAFNKATYDKEVNTAKKNTDTRQQQQQRQSGFEMITPTTYDDTKVLEQYYAKLVDIKKKAVERQKQIDEENLVNQRDFQKDEEELRYKRLMDINGGEYIKQLRAGVITQEQYNKLTEDEEAAHYARLNAIDKEYASELSALTTDSLEEVYKLYSDYFGNVVNLVRQDKSKIDETLAKQPEVDKYGWGVVMIGKVKKAYQTALGQYEELKKGVVKKQQELDQELKQGHISAEDFAIRKKELDDEMKSIDQNINELKLRQRELVEQFVQSLMPYVQAAMDSFNTIMQAVWDAEDAAFDREEEQIEKENDAIEDALSKQENIVQQHKSAIDEIEEELSTARGARRQHLIDQINAEIAAQRAAAKEEQKLQRKKEANEKKQEQLEKKRKKAEYDRQILQAIVNGAMAVTYAAMNTWPTPAIPLMALAAATTAAQVAMMKANRPSYGKGGQLEGGLVKGKRHSEGGVPVGNTGIFVEGEEMIVRRESTIPNVDLLEYINSKKRRMSLDDFIDFYTSGKLKSNIKSISPSSKYAEGGQLTLDTSNVNINDRLLDAFESYSRRPMYVSVVDIQNKMDDVNTIKALAGIR